jgi:predicted DNA-binding transcriptional regulator AlpA
MTSLEVRKEKLGGISENVFRKIAAQPWFASCAKPRVLGPKTLRWVEAEVDRAILNSPVQDSPAPEPARLLRGRIERLKHGPAAAASAVPA